MDLETVMWPTAMLESAQPGKFPGGPSKYVDFLASRGLPRDPAAERMARLERMADPPKWTTESRGYGVEAGPQRRRERRLALREWRAHCHGSRRATRREIREHRLKEMRWRTVIGQGSPLDDPEACAWLLTHDWFYRCMKTSDRKADRLAYVYFYSDSGLLKLLNLESPVNVDGTDVGRNLRDEAWRAMRDARSATSNPRWNIGIQHLKSKVYKDEDAALRAAAQAEVDRVQAVTACIGRPPAERWQSVLRVCARAELAASDLATTPARQDVVLTVSSSWTGLSAKSLMPTHRRTRLTLTVGLGWLRDVYLPGLAHAGGPGTFVLAVQRLNGTVRVQVARADKTGKRIETAWTTLPPGEPARREGFAKRWRKVVLAMSAEKTEG